MVLDQKTIGVFTISKIGQDDTNGINLEAVVGINVITGVGSAGILRAEVTVTDGGEETPITLTYNKETDSYAGPGYKDISYKISK